MYNTVRYINKVDNVALFRLGMEEVIKEAKEDEVVGDETNLGGNCDLNNYNEITSVCSECGRKIDNTCHCVFGMIKEIPVKKVIKMYKNNFTNFKTLQPYLSNTTTYAYYLNGKIVGCFSYKINILNGLEIADVILICSGQEHRSLGIGSSLLDFIKKKYVRE